MSESTALVDAPIQRFTGIVTGADPLDELAPMPPPPAPMPESLAATPDPVHVAAELAPLAAAPGRAAPERAGPDRAGPAQPRPRFHAAPALFGAAPALFGIAVAGLTAIWLLRRESHGRSR